MYINIYVHFNTSPLLSIINVFGNTEYTNLDTTEIAITFFPFAYITDIFSTTQTIFCIFLLQNMFKGIGQNIVLHMAPKLKHKYKYKFIKAILNSHVMF